MLGSAVAPLRGVPAHWTLDPDSVVSVMSSIWEKMSPEKNRIRAGIQETLLLASQLLRPSTCQPLNVEEQPYHHNGQQNPVG